MSEHPIIGIVTCTKEILGGKFHAVYDMYLVAVTQHTQAVPILITDVGHQMRSSRLTALVGTLDGLLLTGGPTCVTPELYGQELTSDCKLDPARDAFVVDLLPVAIAEDIPTLGICLGAQEINVCCGGTLYQDLSREARFLDHTSNRAPVVADRYGVSHLITLEAGGVLERLLPATSSRRDIGVNSLHRQGIDRLGRGIRVEARSEDGLVEALSVREATFVVGVQWHLEWMLASPGLSRSVLEAFVRHTQDRYERRHGRLRDGRPQQA